MLDSNSIAKVNTQNIDAIASASCESSDDKVVSPPSENAATVQQSKGNSADTEAQAQAVEELANHPRILDRFADDLERAGVVGEDRAAKLIYLVVTSRILDRPVCAVVKGQSSGGKSYLADNVLKFFPSTAIHRLTSMTEKALVHGPQRALVNRVLFFAEASGLAENKGAYMLRSLISEGHISQETTVQGKDGSYETKIAKRDGPTGFLATTTQLSLDGELETRLLSIPINDTAEQTAAIFLSFVDDTERATVDYKPWRSLQEKLWKKGTEKRVVIPYGKELATSIPPIATRMRRDVSNMLQLIRTHAILHQATRERNAEGRIVATLEDYRVVHELIADLLAVTLEASVPPTVRETVKAVDHLLSNGQDHIGQATLRAHLDLDKSTVSRRVAQAVEAGYLVDMRETEGVSSKLVIGDPLPDEQEILPSPQSLAI